MAVFITGDKHGDLYKLTSFIDRFGLTNDDAIIVLGDMGLFWRKDKKETKQFLDYYAQNDYMTNIYFIDGNHDNFDLINKLEYEANSRFKNCGNPYIHYIPRGTTFSMMINGISRRFLACGGADSIDKFLRYPHLSWWEDEKITQADIDKTLAVAANRHIDYVLSHCCPISIFKKYAPWLITLTGIDQSGVDHTSEEMLEQIMDNIDFDKWYFGHYHIDKKLDNKFTCVFNDFIRLD